MDLKGNRFNKRFIGEEVQQGGLKGTGSTRGSKGNRFNKRFKGEQVQQEV